MTQDTLLEAIPLSTYKFFMKNHSIALSRRYEKVWKKHQHDNPKNTQYRLFYPFVKGEAVVDKDKRQENTEIVELLKTNGYIIEDYTRNSAYKDKDYEKKVNKTTITKVLTKLKRIDLVDAYNKQIGRLGKKESDKPNYEIVISRHFYDYLGQSTGRHYDNESCKRLMTVADKYEPATIDNLQRTIGNWRYLPEEYNNGWLVAYLIDTNKVSRRGSEGNHPRNEALEDPVARVNIIPYVKEDKPEITRLFVSDEQVFGTNVSGFAERVGAIIDELGLRRLKPQGVYCAPNAGYTGTIDNKKKVFLSIEELKTELIKVYGEDKVQDGSEGDILLTVTDLDFDTLIQSTFPLTLEDMKMLAEDFTKWTVVDDIILNFDNPEQRDGVKHLLDFFIKNKIKYSKDEDVIDEIFTEMIYDWYEEFKKYIPKWINNWVYNGNMVWFRPLEQKVVLDITQNDIQVYNKVIDSMISKGDLFENYIFSSINNPKRKENFNFFEARFMLDEYQECINWWIGKLGKEKSVKSTKVSSGKKSIEELIKPYSVFTVNSLVEYKDILQQLEDVGLVWNSGDKPTAFAEQYWFNGKQFVKSGILWGVRIGHTGERISTYNESNINDDESKYKFYDYNDL